jgi:hypothetical protein
MTLIKAASTKGKKWLGTTHVNFDLMSKFITLNDQKLS